MAPRISDPASSGHKLGQEVGDWWELYVVFPMLEDIAKRLDLFLDNRCVSRECRAEKIEWADVYGNIVDYDFVLELEGTPKNRGIPVAFFESFWRRGARHSKDKARDDTNKLLPMRDTFPTARYLAITACGEFTSPAREYVQNRNVALFYIPKSQIVRAFREAGLEIDYADNANEILKAQMAAPIAAAFKDQARKVEVADHLRRIVGGTTFDAFAATVVGRLSAVPQEIRFVHYDASQPVRFDSVRSADAFLGAPAFPPSSGNASYGYEVTYSDGTEFSRRVKTLEELGILHASLARLVAHIDAVRDKGSLGV